MNHRIEIGNPRGRIAILCDETEAWDIYHGLHSDDLFRKDIADAIERAYPKSEDNEEPGIVIYVDFGTRERKPNHAS